MKAFLLAAGRGTRLRPFTDSAPKCLLTIGGRTMLDIWLDTFAATGVREVLVNTHHFADQVKRHLAARSGSPIVRTVFEETLLGSAGTLVANSAWVRDEEMFLACNADNLTDFDLDALVSAHRQGGAAATLALFHAQRPSECGIVEVDREGLMTSFTEKPDEPVSDLANAGIYAFAPAVIDELAGSPPMDIGYDLLPRLVGRARTVTVGGYFRDIGSPEAIECAEREWPVQVSR